MIMNDLYKVLDFENKTLYVYNKLENECLTITQDTDYNYYQHLDYRYIEHINIIDENTFFVSVASHVKNM